LITSPEHTAALLNGVARGTGAVAAASPAGVVASVLSGHSARLLVAMVPTWPTADEAVAMPVEDLAVRVLWRINSGRWGEHGTWPNRSGQIGTWVVEWATSRGAAAGRSQQEILMANRAQVEALAEAWEWLRAEALLAAAVVPGNSSHDAYFVTRRGVELLETENPLAFVRAQRRLGVELHPDLASRLNPLVRAGAFEQAAFDALRQVEVRIGDLAGGLTDQRGSPLRGVPLMQEAFRDSGPLADSTADPGERRGVRELFTGAFGAVRNPLGHRNVEWTDPVEAAEMVLLADLLMRQLDRIQRRPPASGPVS
jgi:uncharacterized protein (TIGR02391 family)